MSLIHEALEKLDQEKKSGWRRPTPVSTPEPRAHLPKEESSKNHGVLYAMAGVLVFFFLAGLVYFFTRPETDHQFQPTQKSSFHALFPRGPFTLTGITQVGSDHTAIVNNHLVRVGDGVDGAVVESIDESGVVLGVEGQKVELNLYGDSNTHLTRLEVSR